MWIQVSLLLTLFAVLYVPVFRALLGTWWENDVYNHGFLVPFISAYLVWIKRERLGQLTPSPNFCWGMTCTLLAGLMLLLGRLGAVVLLQEISLLVMIVGLVLSLMGWPYLKALALPIAYLSFMIPIFMEGTDWVHWPFQLLAANIGVWLLQSLGFVALREAQYIHLPRITLEVAEACSGIRFIISVIAIGIPLAYFTQRTWPRKVGLVAFAVAIAILANGLRVTLIGIWASWGGEVTHGPLHVFQAMFVAWIGYVALFAGAWFLAGLPAWTRGRSTAARTETVALGRGAEDLR